MIQEVIVVEGKDDIAAVKRAVDAQVYATGGLWFGRNTIEKIENFAKRSGVILLTDPDYAGDKIRSRISRRVPSCKHAFLPRALAVKKGDIGVENASPQDIKNAIMRARPILNEKRVYFHQARLYQDGLIGPDSKEKREKMGMLLGIGYGNGKQFLDRLNHFGIEEEEYRAALEEVRHG